MLEAKEFVEILKRHSIGPFCGVPCSLLRPIIDQLQSDKECCYLAATSEGEAMGISAGMSLCGRLPAVLMQNSGLGNAVNPLTSLHLVYKIPALLLISLRGDPHFPDQPEHSIMGKITTGLLDTVGLHHEMVRPSRSEFDGQIERLATVMSREKMPVALIIRKGDINTERRGVPPDGLGAPPLCSPVIESGFPSLQRKEAISEIMALLTGQEAVISSTGKISRELFFRADAENNFYMVGSMGCAAPVGLGIAHQKPHSEVLILDGDGAVLMKMGAMPTIGHYRPENLTHIVLDNECYDSTGGQATASRTTFLERVAVATGYRTSARVYSAEKLGAAVLKAMRSHGPHFILCKVLPGADKNLGRASLTCEEIRDRFMKFLRSPVAPSRSFQRPKRIKIGAGGC